MDMFVTEDFITTLTATPLDACWLYPRWHSSVAGINPTSLPLDVARLDVRMLRIIGVEQTVLAADWIIAQ